MPSNGMSMGHSNWNIIDYLCQDSTATTTFRFKTASKVFSRTKFKFSSKGTYTRKLVFLKPHTLLTRQPFVHTKPVNRIATKTALQNGLRPRLHESWRLTLPSVVQIIRNNQINLGGCKNFNQSATEGQILTLLLAWEWDFKSKINWGISLPHRIVFGAAASCDCSLSRVENVQEKPLGQGKS